MLVPATIIEDENQSHSRKNYNRKKGLPYGARVVENGYYLGGYFYPDYSTKEGIQMTKTSILPKLEFIFSDKYLTADKFLRQSMNAEGYFPILLLFYLPVIQSYGVTAEFLAEVLSESEFADVDLSQMTVRPKNWQKWILPAPAAEKVEPQVSVATEQ